MKILEINDEPSIQLENVTYTYQGMEKPALKNINLCIKKGETIMISGSAGAGKTTLCRMLNGLIPHFFRGKLEGKVHVNGLDIKKHSPAYLAHIVGLMFQEPETQLVCPTVMDELAFGPENYGIAPKEIRKRVEEVVKAMRLENYKETNPHFLSGGEQQACALGAIMTMRPEVFVLDEPTSNIDPIGSSQVLNLLMNLSKQQKSTVIIVEHKMEDLLPFVDRLILMEDGGIVLEGSPRNLLKHVQFMEKIGTKPPQVTLLASRLKERYEDISLPLTLDEGLDVFSKLLEEKKGRLLVAKEKPADIHVHESREKILEANGLWHIYPGGTVALKEINLSIFRGEFVAIIGQNGSGKTTLVKHFNGLLKPSQGRVYVFGVDTETATISDLSKKVGYCFQNPDFQLCCNTVKEELEFGPRNMKISEKEISDRVKVVAAAIEFEDVLDRKPFSLSKGERQKLAVGSILTMKPDVLIIDEPTTGQDFGTAKEMMDFYRRLNEEEGKTIIVITHDMNLAAEYAKRVIVLKGGQILLDGDVKEIFVKSEELETTFLKPPQITRLGLLLKKYGLHKNILTVDDMFESITDILEVR